MEPGKILNQDGDILADLVKTSMEQACKVHTAFGKKIEIYLKPNYTMNFGQAIEALKSGQAVARAGWNGKGMYLYYVPANTYPAVTEIAKKEFGDLVPYGAYIAMKTAQDNVVPWLASQTDMLAEDWSVLPTAVV